MKEYLKRKIISFDKFCYIFQYKSPSSIHSWSISHILKYEFFCFGLLGSYG